MYWNILKMTKPFLKDFVNSKYVNHETIFIITVPAYQKLFFSHDTFLKHFRRYTNTSLVRLIKKCGLDEIEKGYFFLSLLAPRYLSVQKERITGTHDLRMEQMWATGMVILS